MGPLDKVGNRNDLQCKKREEKKMENQKGVAILGKMMLILANDSLNCFFSTTVGVQKAEFPLVVFFFFG